jgi:hypothetical protein
VGQAHKGGEEAEMCLRIKQRIPGSLILYEPRALLYHKVSPDRAKLMYQFKFCLNEGITRANVRKLSKSHSKKPLATENTFLKRLAFQSLKKAIKIYKPAEVVQAWVIFVCVALLGGSFMLERLKHW